MGEAGPPPNTRVTTAEKLLAHNTREKKTLAWQRPETGQSQRVGDSEMRCASVAVKVTSPTGFLCLPACL